MAFYSHVIYERQNTRALGVRGEAAYLFAPSSKLAVGPRLAFSYGRLEPFGDRVVTAYNTYTTEGNAHWFSGGTGIEFQAFRYLVLSPELGLVGLLDQGRFQGGVLRGRFSDWAHTSPLARVTAGGRLPLFGRTGLGVMAGGEFFWCKDDIVPRTLRGVLQVFVDSAAKLGPR
ncbi:MAG: hypothetical protein JW751_25680 [Polyangiaceae bacterium]|nr:hypothetical protein [Polyangiaceae bacterium]